MADPAQLTLKDVLCDEELAHLFRDFLHQLHSSENLAFWLDVEDFKQISDNYPDIRRQRAKRIYQKYFSADSQSQVNMDASLKEVVQLQLESQATIKPTLFDEMQDFVYSMMECDSYRKFLSSNEFKAWVASGGTKKPSSKPLFSFFKRRKYKDKDKRKDDGFKSESLVLLENHLKNAKK